ncbi:hypothetical protein EJ110_NYTH08841 [Nymphaea thermarum]|nr:hypothetical protein EJ110_NYTH08841 [Nymphaea thermarum]
MAYVEKGVVKTKRSIWRLSYIRDLFLSVINLIVVFFTTMFSTPTRKSQVLAVDGMVVQVVEVLEEALMEVALVDSPVEWITSEALITVLFLLVVHVVEAKSGLSKKVKNAVGGRCIACNNNVKPDVTKENSGC